MWSLCSWPPLQLSDSPGCSQPGPPLDPADLPGVGSRGDRWWKVTSSCGGRGPSCTPQSIPTRGPGSSCGWVVGSCSWHATHVSPRGAGRAGHLGVQDPRAGTARAEADSAASASRPRRSRLRIPLPLSRLPRTRPGQAEVGQAVPGTVGADVPSLLTLLTCRGCLLLMNQDPNGLPA